MNENIVFIGFMGVGKSTLAKKLAKKLNTVCLDTDKIIENMEGEKIKTIFEKHGEAYFRELEKTTALWLEQSVKRTIISTGGGFIKVENLKKIGKVVYLKSTFEGIIERISKHPKAKEKFAKRPLLKDKKTAKKLFEEREEIYQKLADITISIEKYKNECDIIAGLADIIGGNRQ